MQDLVNIAKISGTHHLKGILKAASVLDNCSAVVGKSIIVELQTGVQKLFTVINCERMNDKMITLELEGVTNINSAKALIGSKVYVRRDILGTISEDEYYLVDLIEMDVVTDEGENIGKITDVFATGAHDIYVVTDGEKEIMIPAVDNFVKSIDFEKRVITVKLIEGMR